MHILVSWFFHDSSGVLSWKKKRLSFLFSELALFFTDKVNELHFTLKRKQRRQYQVLSA